MSNLYEVMVPFAGYLHVSVEAESEAEAEERVLGMNVQCRFTTGSGQEGKPEIDHYEWELYKNICSGNVLYTPLNYLSVEFIEEV